MLEVGGSIPSPPTIRRQDILREAKGGAGDGLRTRYLNLGKVALYRVSYSRIPGKGHMVPEVERRGNRHGALDAPSTQSPR
jgi:hypothetical protein